MNLFAIFIIWMMFVGLHQPNRFRGTNNKKYESDCLLYVVLFIIVLLLCA